MTTSSANKTTANPLSDRICDIPTLPAVASRVNALLNDPKSSSSDIAEVLKKDQVLTAKILRLVNSSYYSIPGGVTDIKRALAFLGFNTLAQLILGVSVFSLFKDVDGEDFSMQLFWRHALATGICAETIAKHLKISKPEEVFTCGLLHDIGKLVLHEIDADRFKYILTTAKARQCGFTEVERADENSVPGHARLGELMAERWGLPHMIRQAIRYHHTDVSRLDTISAQIKPVISLVRLADAFVLKNKIGKSGDFSVASVTKIDESLLSPLGLNASNLPELEKLIDAQIQKAGALMNGYSKGGAA